MRKLRRLISKTKMKKAGIHKPFRKVGGTSFFAEHWREYIR